MVTWTKPGSWSSCYIILEDNIYCFINYVFNLICKMWTSWLLHQLLVYGYYLIVLRTSFRLPCLAFVMFVYVPAWFVIRLRCVLFIWMFVIFNKSSSSYLLLFLPSITGILQVRHHNNMWTKVPLMGYYFKQYFNVLRGNLSIS